MPIKFLMTKDIQKYTLSTIKKLLKQYNAIEFNIEIQRDNYTQKEFGKKLPLYWRIDEKNYKINSSKTYCDKIIRIYNNN
jgi:hypothetical protein